jgi:uncharacterized protein YjiS (DUF1127 family)
MTYATHSKSFLRPHRSILALIRLALAVRRERKALVELDQHLLNDLGLDRQTAISEARRKLWDVPHHWRV